MHRYPRCIAAGNRGAATKNIRKGAAERALDIGEAKSRDSASNEPEATILFSNP